MPDSIIVYRNPMEKMFWEHSGDVFIYIFSMMICCFALYFIFTFINKNIFKKEIMLMVWIVVGCALGVLAVQFIR